MNVITTISTDFNFIGKKAAELILNGSDEHLKVPLILLSGIQYKAYAYSIGYLKLIASCCYLIITIIFY
jgi:hypothetical protein